MVSDSARGASDDALNRFLQVLMRDVASGGRRDVEAYRAEFPQIADQIETELAGLESGDPSALEAAAPELRSESGPGELRSGELGPGARIGPYRILSELGRGGQGAVFLARDERLGREVALKLLPALAGWSPDLRQRFRREAQIAARLDHPGLCPVFEADEFDGLPYVAMRHVEGETLAAMLDGLRARGERLDEARACELTAQAARALHAAHTAGCVHRDVKPGNLMLDREGQIVVLDFGLARDFEEDSELTQTGDVFGTPRYMAPEQVDPAIASASPVTDVWALGAVLFELVCAAPAFDAPSRDGLYRHILSGEPREPDGVRLGRDVRTIIATALAKEPGRRYATAEALAEDLERSLAGRPILARPAGPLERTWLWAKRAPRRAALVGLLLAALAGIGALGGYLSAKSGTLRAGELELERQERLDLIANVFGGGVATDDATETDDALERWPTSSSIRSGTAYQLARTGNAARALALLDAAPADADSPRSLRRMRAFVLHKLGDVEGAAAIESELGAPQGSDESFVAALLAADGTQPTDPESFAPAVDLALRSVLLDPKPARHQLALLARVSVSAQRFDLAEPVVAALLERFPESSQAWFYQGLLTRNSDPEASVNAYARATELEPGFSQAHLSLAIGLALRGDTQLADDAYERAVESSHTTKAKLQTILTWCRILVALRDDVACAAQAERALTLDPESAMARSTLDAALDRLAAAQD